LQHWEQGEELSYWFKKASAAKAEMVAIRFHTNKYQQLTIHKLVILLSCALLSFQKIVRLEIIVGGYIVLQIKEHRSPGRCPIPSICVAVLNATQ
jgi:hypothetical protein